MIRELVSDDIAWVAEQMEWRRALYAALSPRFWNPAEGVSEAHGTFLRWLIDQPDVLALRSDRGFAIGTVQGTRLFIDDFAVEDDELWPIDGAALVVGLWEAAPAEADHVRVVTAKLDEPKCRLLTGLGLRPAARWWVGAIEGAEDAAGRGPHDVAGHEAMLMDAPPVYEPGGPVCLVELSSLVIDPTPTATDAPVDAEQLRTVSLGAAELGAALLILTDEQSDAGPPPEERPELTEVGFHNPSVFYDGVPAKPE